MPNRDEKLEFTILFEENEKVVWTEKFVSKIIVPHMECKNVATDEIRITEQAAEISLRLELLISGTASVKDVRPISRIVRSGKDIELTVVADNSEQPEIALSPPFVNYKLVIKGTGFALVQIGFEYEDFNSNKYATEMNEITIEKTISEITNVPIQGILTGNVPLLVSRS